MNILIDVFLELLEGSVAPSSERGLVSTFAASSAVLLSLTMWVLMTSPEPLRQPAWALIVFAGSMIAGGTGVFVALLHWARNRSDRWFSAVSATISGAAVAFPVLWLAAR